MIESLTWPGTGGHDFAIARDIMNNATGCNRMLYFSAIVP
jgi:hypothetical protein